MPSLDELPWELVDKESSNFVSFVLVFFICGVFLQVCLSAGETNRLYAGIRGLIQASRRQQPLRRIHTRSFPVPRHLRDVPARVLNTLSYKHLKQVYNYTPLSEAYQIRELHLDFDLLPESARIIICDEKNAIFSCETSSRTDVLSNNISMQLFWGVNAECIENELFSKSLATKTRGNGSSSDKLDNLIHCLRDSSTSQSSLLFPQTNKDSGIIGASNDCSRYRFAAELPNTTSYFPAVFVLSSRRQDDTVEQLGIEKRVGALLYIVNGVHGIQNGEDNGVHGIQNGEDNGGKAESSKYTLSCVSKIAISGSGEAFALQPIFGLERDKTSGIIDSCVVCLDRVRNVILIPCRHMVVCHGCASRLEECPICKVKYTSLVELEPDWDAANHAGFHTHREEGHKND